jgi:hypothetical protein
MGWVVGMIACAPSGRAQQKLPVIGFLGLSPETTPKALNDVRNGLAEIDYKFLIPIVNSLDQRARSRIGPYIEREHYRSGRGARPPSTSRAVPPLRSGRTAPNGMMMARVRLKLWRTPSEGKVRVKCCGARTTS